MRRLLFSAGFFLLCMVVYGNNIRVNGEARVVDFIGSGRDTAIVEFGVSWDNSWRDDFNWDAAWVFLKYKKRGLTAPWEHAYLSREGHESVPQSGDTGNYDFMVGEVGEGASSKVTGLFLMRDGISEGSVNVKLRLKWPLQGNGRLPLQAEDFGVNLDSVFVAAYAIEMVYVPYGGFYFGDGFSNKSFFRQGKGVPFPAEADIIDNVSGYEYTINKEIITGPISNIADRNTISIWPNSSLYFQAVGGAYLQIDFKSPKMIRYFAIAAASNYCAGNQDCRPKGNWYLKGSNDLTNWDELYIGTGDDWLGSTSSYPVQNTLKVQHPGSYRYYRIVMSGARRSDDGIVIQNIAMTEEDLERAVIDSEDPLYLIAADGQTWTHQLPAAYPKGYRGFYAMKYEVSQEQYVEFLNSLTLAQQKNRVMNNDFEHMSKGDYVFGDVKRPNCRNGITFLMQKGEGAPALFGNNLNPDNKFYSEDDGQTLACNYLSPADMLAYCDWSGLRPMSELEYEKSCRRPSPQIPEKGEYAWNSNSGVNRLRTFSDLTGAQTERETPFDYKVNVNAGGRLNGPVRSGAFATSRTGQLEAGATYWGLMEMSGNLWELCYNATAAGSVFKGDDVSYSHGDGTLNADGSTDIGASYWPSSVAAFGVRGGSFVSADSLLRTSDRTCSWGNFFLNLTKRDSSVGFRGVRSMLNTAGFTAGRIYCANGLERDSVCAGIEYVITGEPAGKTIGRTTYSWYVSEDNGVSWRMLEGATSLSLNYNAFVNSTTALKAIQFKRKAVCSVGEETTDPVVIEVSPSVIEIPCTEKQHYVAWGGPLKVYCNVKADGYSIRWKKPDRAVLDRDTLFVSSVTAGDVGTYGVCFVNSYGCEGAEQKFEVIQAEKITIIRHPDGYRMWSNGKFAHSANEYRHPKLPYVYEGETGDGVYRLCRNECEEIVYDAYCDMTSDGGGWTMVVAQFETDPVSNWDEGIQPDYDPTLATKRSFCLNTLQLPRHTQIAFGKDQDATYVGYSNFVYTTGDIPTTNIWNEKEAVYFQIHRNKNAYYNYHNPSTSGYSGNVWNNTLTYDQINIFGFNWAFSSQQTSRCARGYAMKRAALGDSGTGGVFGSCSNEDYAWTVWVR